ncbi:hypothetical protein [Nostoc punctiforme]|uniref:hypothetical protein n=1 Tax=Nostoc punctiforme TaxID=272131 RepID=UPI0002DC4B8A|nr:hypothetical protein [Nostoc punctiforme]
MLIYRVPKNSGKLTFLEKNRNKFEILAIQQEFYNFEALSSLGLGQLKGVCSQQFSPAQN